MNDRLKELEERNERLFRILGDLDAMEDRFKKEKPKLATLISTIKALFTYIAEE